jgi:predicted nucleic acid-binding protein
VRLMDAPAPAGLTEDSDDDYLAALALSSGAQYLVTGDRAPGRWRSDRGVRRYTTVSRRVLRITNRMTITRMNLPRAAPIGRLAAAAS